MKLTVLGCAGSFPAAESACSAYLLEADGLLVRVRDPHDRRRHIVTLTAMGRSRLTRAWQAAEAAEAELLAPLSDHEREQLRGMLERLDGHASGPGTRC